MGDGSQKYTALLADLLDEEKSSFGEYIKYLEEQGFAKKTKISASSSFDLLPSTLLENPSGSESKEYVFILTKS